MKKYGRVSEDGRLGESSVDVGAKQGLKSTERANKTYKEIREELRRRHRRNQQEEIIEEL